MFAPVISKVVLPSDYNNTMNSVTTQQPVYSQGLVNTCKQWWQTVVCVFRPLEKTLLHPAIPL